MGVAGLLPSNAESTFFSKFGNFGQHRLTIGADRDGNGGMTLADSTKPIAQHFKHHRFPAEIIGHAV
ncbi:hypothetical protein EHI44_10525 [Rhizobium leguminosarum]|uniref:hypothetical protein n=1 Tax=Rhizobium leguminosarum TaxID=384 RepID=UPI0002D9D509|nr:hypothetical protein [Rhizobium leguminosarum]RWY88493.1 hypothetical protein EHI44_10525 [Rhizobium leguminosarum]